jgi:hypothetical protein
MPREIRAQIVDDLMTNVPPVPFLSHTPAPQFLFVRIAQGSLRFLLICGSPPRPLQVMCGINPALLPNELAAEDTNFLSVPGTLPISLDSALSILPIAYKAEELLAQVTVALTSCADPGSPVLVHAAWSPYPHRPQA